MRNEYSNENILPAFTNSADKKIMLLIKEAYQNCFLGIETARKNIPDVLNVIEKTKPFLFFFSSKILYLTRLLTPQELQLAHFQNYSEIFNQSINRKQVNAVLSTGIDYIHKEENSHVFHQPYSNIQNATYYCIYVILKIVQELSQASISEELIKEYACLESFLTEILFISNNHHYTKNNTNFHYFLYEAHDKICTMKKRTQFYYERNSISQSLFNIVHLLEAYKGDLAEFIFYSLSEAKDPGTFTASYLDEKNDKRIDPEFLQSQAYTNLRAAYTNNENIEDLPLISRTTKGSPKFIDRFNEYNHLLKLLYNFSFLTRNINLLYEGSILNGEWETARDEKLNAILKINLKLIVEYISEISRNIDSVKNLSIEYSRKNAYLSSEFKKNTYYASKKTTPIEKIKSTIQLNISQIKNRIKNIKKLDSRIKEIIKDKLIINTENLINRIESKSILSPESTLKLINKIDTNKNKIIKRKKISITDKIKSSNYLVSFPEYYNYIKNNEASKKIFHDEIEDFDFTINETFYLFHQSNNTKKKLIQWMNEEIEKNNSSTVSSLLSGIKFCIQSEQKKEEKYKKEIFLCKKEKEKNIEKILIKMNLSLDQERENLMDCVKRELLRKIKLLENYTNFIQDALRMSVSGQESIEEYYERNVKQYFEKRGIQKEITNTDSGELVVINVELLNANTSTEIKSNMTNLFNFLLKTDYVIHYFGGQTIVENGVAKKVPHHVKHMFNFYKNHFAQLDVIDDAVKVRKEIFNIAKSAGSKKRSFFSFFNFRSADTQKIYDNMNSAHAQYSPASMQ